VLKSVTHVQIRACKLAQISGTKNVCNSLSIRMNNTHVDPNTT